MPELPEVETVRRIVETHLIGKTIDRVDVRLPKLLRDSPIPHTDVLVAAAVTGARRRAKILVIDFSNSLSLLVHFKLAGQFAVDLPNGTRVMAGHPVPAVDAVLPHKSTHAEIRFTDGTMVHYSDIRQFGWWRIVEQDAVPSIFESFGFGPEGVDESLDVAALGEVMGRRGIPIKTLLLDQSFIAGLGNIYVDEVLWRVRIHPATPANAVSTVKRRAAIRAIPGVLADGIAQGGVKIVHSVAYPIDEFPSVHGREGEPCIRCGTTIRKTRVGQRGTYYCPKCQKIPRERISGKTIEEPVN